MSDSNLQDVILTAAIVNGTDTRLAEDELSSPITMFQFILFNCCVAIFGYYVWLIFPRPKTNDNLRLEQQARSKIR
ncbi:unnamed protein product [Cylicocyclus nassatus]|uniref:Uncharacterized protein n=1 Tax=Cylicocyclus nassatus TaxID=53992 RepID=A0AA36HAX5_CYLNA|nr:unnamed protein product [Cylicocyclus nassatus]